MSQPTKIGDPADRVSNVEGQDQFQTSHRAGYGTDDAKTQRIIEWLTKNPHATLASGEGGLLLRYIRQLEQQLQERQ
jgi:hypothetical protein